MDTFSIQLWTFLSLLVANFFAGLVPSLVVLAACRLSCHEHFVHRRNRIVTTLLVFGGGVLMSTCFLVLIPQARRHFETQAANDETAHKETFPIPEFIVMCGFFLTFGIEELLHYIVYHFRSKRDNCRDVRVRFCSCAKRHTECSRTFKADIPDQTLFGLEKKNAELEHSGFSRQIDPVTNMHTTLLQSQGIPSYGTVTDERTNTPVNVMTPSPMMADHGNIVISQQNTDTHLTSNILLLMALSCHAVFQGLKIGLSSSEPWTLIFVLCLQQTILVFVVGNVGQSNSGVTSTTLAYVTAMSIMSPVGVGITMLLNDELSNELVFGVVKALLCGSLLYFTFCDWLRRPLLKAEPHVSRFVGFTLGAVIVGVLLYVSGIL